jgi:hypothetical protein
MDFHIYVNLWEGTLTLARLYGSSISVAQLIARPGGSPGFHPIQKGHGFHQKWADFRHGTTMYNPYRGSLYMGKMMFDKETLEFRAGHQKHWPRAPVTWHVTLQCQT